MSESPLYLRTTAYFDGARFCRGDFLLKVVGGRIAALTPFAAADPADLRQVTSELLDAVLVPPISDSHIHSFLDPWPIDPDKRKRTSPEMLLDVSAARVQDAPASGIGLLRDGGDPLGINLEIRRRLTDDLSEERPVAEYLVPGPAINRPGRYGSFLGESVADRDAMKDLLHRLGQEDVDFIKIIPTGIINFAEGRVKGAPQFETDDLQYLVDACHGEGWSVMAHASGAEGIRQAVRCGVDFIEHGYFVERETLDLMAETGAAWTPTFAPVWVQMVHADVCGWDPHVREKLRVILEGHGEALAYARDAGVPVLTGSDAGAPGVDQKGGIFLELALMQEYGMGVESLLQASCIRTPARLAGRNRDPWGVGAPARFMICPPGVMKDVCLLRDTRSVVWDGKILCFKRPHITEPATDQEILQDAQ